MIILLTQDSNILFQLSLFRFLYFSVKAEYVPPLPVLLDNFYIKFTEYLSVRSFS